MNVETTSAPVTTSPATVEDAKKAARIPRSKGEKKEAAPKAAPKGKKASAPKAAPSGKAASFFIAANPPAGGALLHEHTEAFFRIYGMHGKGGAPLNVAKMVLRDTAINYHVKNGRMFKENGKLFLSDAGKLHFGARLAAINEEGVKTYMAIMTTGKADGAYVKSQAAIAKVA